MIINKSNGSAGMCDNCQCDCGTNRKRKAYFLTPYEELENITLFLCEDCVKKIGDDEIQTWLFVQEQMDRLL